MVIFGFGTLLLFDLPAFVGLLGLVPLLVWYSGKSSLVVPRVGSIHPGRELKQRFQGMLVSLCVIGIGLLVLFLLGRGTGRDFISAYPLTLLGVVLAMGISGLGLLLDANRFYFYAGLVFLAMAGGEALQGSIADIDTFLLAVISAGFIILLAGLILLINFLKKYPVIHLEQ